MLRILQCQVFNWIVIIKINIHLMFDSSMFVVVYAIFNFPQNMYKCNTTVMNMYLKFGLVVMKLFVVFSTSCILCTHYI